MTLMSHVEENIRLADDGYPHSLSTQELSLIRRVTEVYRKMLKVDCTGCAYCMPCETGVNIPVNFQLYNDTFLFKDPEMNVMLYNNMLSPEQRASHCTECGDCEEACPQRIKIMDELKNVHKKLSPQTPT
jgi:hypothetical protein